MTVTASCPKCSRAFTFDITQTPAQRAGREGSPGWWTVLGYYPDCPHCTATVEITHLGGNPPPRLPHRKP